MENFRFTTFSTGGVSLGTLDIIHDILSFIKGIKNHTAAADNKFNVKNDQCHFIGGSSKATIGNYFIGC